ncbi:MAG: hypothetical protein PHY16_07870 [Methylobacter sp.]|nr:hypothetical protein [Methylobacter sp.]
MPAAVYVENLDIDQRLALLGLKESLLREAMTQGYLARARLTANHPRIFHGTSTWAETVASLRELLRPEGWEKSDIGNYELTLNSTRDIAIQVVTGDEGTGLAQAMPSNKCPKGRNTIEAVINNRQLDMFEELIPQPYRGINNLSTWILLYRITKEVVRCELSLPSTVSEEGRITGWKERILLRPLYREAKPFDVRPSQHPEIDIPIKRKAR